MLYSKHRPMVLCDEHVSHCSFFSFVRSWERPSWPKCPAIIVIDSATYLLMTNSPDINKVAMSLYNIFSLSSSVLYTYLMLP